MHQENSGSGHPEVMADRIAHKKSRLAGSYDWRGVRRALGRIMVRSFRKTPKTLPKLLWFKSLWGNLVGQTL